MKSHLNIQSTLKITAFQSEEVYWSWNQVFWFLWCSDKLCWIFCKNCIYMKFSPFSVLLSNISITECIYFHNCHKFQIQKVFFIKIADNDSVCPPPFWHQFLHLLIQFIASMFIDTDRKTVKHANTEKSWRGVSKDQFYMFSVSVRCRMGYRQIRG